MNTISTLLVKSALFAFLLFNSLSGLAQHRIHVSTSVHITTNEAADAQGDLDQLIEKFHLKPGRYNKTAESIDIYLVMDQALYDTLMKHYKTWGYVSKEVTSQTDFEVEANRLEEEILRLEQEKTTYAELANYADSSKQGSYLAYREKMMELDRQISNNRQQMEECRRGMSLYAIDLQIYETVNTTMEYSDSWVNMPGVEYSYIWVEQPKAGITPSVMQGVSLKYMFNRGKTYGITGLYKNMAKDTKVNEVYIFALGQDFYSRRLGRGQHKFLNPYTSLNLGVYVQSGEDERTTSWYVNPYFGLELFKNKYFLIDNKIGYFMPFKDNRDMRGLIYSVSLNFVF